MATSKEAALVGAVNDAVLQGEIRELAAPVLDADALAALPRFVRRRRVVVLPVDDQESVADVTMRWATLCAVLHADGNVARFRGERRVLVLTIAGDAAPFVATLHGKTDPSLGSRRKQLLSGAHTLLAALDGGALPRVPAWTKALPPALASLARALTHPEKLQEAVAEPLDLTLKRMGEALMRRGAGEEAVCSLEAILQEAQTEPLDPDLREKLWAQTVAIQKRLDVFDPAEQEEKDFEAEVPKLRRRVSQSGLTGAAKKLAEQRLALLKDMATNHHDYSHFISHLDVMTRLVWHAEPLPKVSLETVEAALEEEHTGLDRAKRRVLEYMAVRSLGGSKASMVLCLAGPPGVGKTSIARALARALGRKLVRVPLGGIHDECEIRGHRLSFLASQPGRIISGLADAGSATAVVLLDEIDKLGLDKSRSPASALLEVLDPEQNHHFQDNYLAVPYDLSKVLFVATANEVSRIDPVLLDRLEVVEIDGYTAREKVAIAKSHLFARLEREYGLPKRLVADEATLADIIESYTREAGVRQLERVLAAIHRSRALVLAKGGEAAKTNAPITLEEARAVLGPPRFTVQTSLAALAVGVAMGLAATADGGTILFIEVGTMPGEGEVRLTGRLGDVMQESAQTAVAYLRIDPARFGIAPAKLARDVHIHVPEGATPKDGPSAGVALVAALVSATTGAALRADVALTGEITLTGRILPVGGVRAKLLAAERAGIRRVVMPEQNRADVPEGVGVEILYVRRVEDAVRAAMMAGSEAPETTVG